MDTTRRGFLAGLGILIAASALPPVADCFVPLDAGEWMYDARLGCFRNPRLTADLLRRNGIRPTGPELRPRDGHEWGVWSPVTGSILDPVATPGLAARLMQKARPIADRFGALDLRAAIPADFGRTKMLAVYGWYR